MVIYLCLYLCLCLSLLPIMLSFPLLLIFLLLLLSPRLLPHPFAPRGLAARIKLRKAFKTHSRRSPKKARGVSTKANICTVVDVEFAISSDLLTVSSMRITRNGYCIAADLYASLTLG